MIRLSITFLVGTICLAAPAHSASQAHTIPQASGQQVQIITPPRLISPPKFTVPSTVRTSPVSPPQHQERAPSANQQKKSAPPPPNYQIQHLYFDTQAPSHYPYCRRGLFGRIINTPCRQRHYHNNYGNFYDSYNDRYFIRR